MAEHNPKDEENKNPNPVQKPNQPKKQQDEADKDELNRENPVAPLPGVGKPSAERGMSHP